MEVVRDILGDVEVTPKDTESYFAVLCQGKVNRVADPIPRRSQESSHPDVHSDD